MVKPNRMEHEHLKRRRYLPRPTEPRSIHFNSVMFRPTRWPSSNRLISYSTARRIKGKTHFAHRTAHGKLYRHRIAGRVQ